jgi:hypothetical protein
MSLSSITEKNGFSVKAYAGDGAILLAFDLEEAKTNNLAGFAIQCISPDRGPYKSNTYWLKNRLSLAEEITGTTEAVTSKREDSNKAPFQLFHWIHYPGAGLGEYKYTIYTCYFKDSTIELRSKVTIMINLGLGTVSPLDLGFTRGYISSQSFEDRFGDDPTIEPKRKSITYDTTPYLKKYKWLGSHARQLVFDFLEECIKNRSAEVDVFAYDFDEPDMIRALTKMGSRVRVFQDNSNIHTDAGSMEPMAIRMLKKAQVKVKTGNFSRFQHNKVLIQKIGGRAKRVLTGSANFSLRGLYVQANSVLVFDDPGIANLYEQAFEQAFTAESKFKSSDISSKWYDLNKNRHRPLISVSFAPHSKAFTIEKITDSVESAESSVFFSIMQLTGGGGLVPLLKGLNKRNGVFSLGTTETTKDLELYKPGIDDNAAIIPFSYLKENVPKPFKKEWKGGRGRVIHHKFVVCDFNDKNPVVFCGSSNLSAGGEKSNGDNLIAIYDQNIATLYAVEAIRLFDHYRFRSLKRKSTSDKPLKLGGTDEWAKPYYDPKNIKFLERQLLCHIPDRRSYI